MFFLKKYKQFVSDKRFNLINKLFYVITYRKYIKYIKYQVDNKKITYSYSDYGIGKYIKLIITLQTIEIKIKIRITNAGTYYYTINKTTYLSNQKERTVKLKSYAIHDLRQIILKFPIIHDIYDI